MSENGKGPEGPIAEPVMDRDEILGLLSDDQDLANLRVGLETRLKNLATEWVHLDTDRQALSERLRLVDLMGFRFRSDGVKGARDEQGRSIQGHNSAVNATKTRLIQIEYQMEMSELYMAQLRKLLEELPTAGIEAPEGGEEEALLPLA